MEIGKSLDLIGVKKEKELLDALSVSSYEAHEEFMGRGVDFARSVLDEYSFCERMGFMLSEGASGWNPDRLSFDNVNERKIRYEVARLYARH